MYWFTYQFEKNPPGLVVMVRSGMPKALSKPKIFTVANPKNGSTTNWSKTPEFISKQKWKDYFDC